VTASSIDAVLSRGSDKLLIAASCTALATLVPVALYQTGVLGGLADPPLRIFDSERVTTSSAAHALGIPDGWLGLGSFGATLALALLTRRHPKIKKLLGAKLTLDASVAVLNATRQVVSFGKLCSWCTATAISAGVMAYAGRDAICGFWGGAGAALKGGMAANDSVLPAGDYQNLDTKATSIVLPMASQELAVQGAKLFRAAIRACSTNRTDPE
jgi:uncharacterized membrane protein